MFDRDVGQPEERRRFQNVPDLPDNEILSQMRDLAAQEGFEVAGALPIGDLAPNHFDAWLAQGFAGNMDYMGRYREQRNDPSKYFAPFLSVVSFILPYDSTPPSASPEIGNIARYALGDDYHLVIKKKLFRIIDALKALDPNLEARALVDTAPLLEKVAAERGGLGWQGKHSNVIREGKGSWFFLAEILVNRPLETDLTSTDRCGICDDCIEACPTRAITAPYVVDSRLCISYLTIELRGIMPRELRGLIGNRIFGCDDCQEVCPWNRLAALPAIEEFEPRAGLRDRTLTEWLEQTLEEWRLTFSKSAVKRTKFDGFKRNVAVAIGNHGADAYVEPIRDALAVAAPVVRAHLIWALRKIDSQPATTLLREWQAMETDPEVLCEFQGDVDSPLAAK
ncbi:MAG: epoxyqueuosine reductase [Planctomycetota bacterium]